MVIKAKSVVQLESNLQLKQIFKCSNERRPANSNEKITIIAKCVQKPALVILTKSSVIKCKNLTYLPLFLRSALRLFIVSKNVLSLNRSAVLCFLLFFQIHVLMSR